MPAARFGPCPRRAPRLPVMLHSKARMSMGRTGSLTAINGRTVNRRCSSIVRTHTRRLVMPAAHCNEHAPLGAAWEKPAVPVTSHRLGRMSEAAAGGPHGIAAGEIATNKKFAEERRRGN